MNIYDVIYLITHAYFCFVEIGDYEKLAIHTAVYIAYMAVHIYK